MALYKFRLTKITKATGVLRDGLLVNGYYYRLLDLAILIEKLNQLGIPTELQENNIVIRLPSTTLQFKNESDFDIIYNLLSLIYFVIKYGSMIFNEVSELNGNFVRIDTNNMIIESSDGSKFYVRYIDPWTFTETFILKIHDRFIASFKGLKVLDVGAEFGDTSVHFARNGAEVIAIEPVSTNYNALLQNLKLNEGIKVTPVKCAIGENGEVTMFYNPDRIDGSASAFYKSEKKEEMVKSYSLSSLLDMLGLKEVDYLKMDCKGCERYLSVEDLKRVKQLAKIEVTLNNVNELSEILKRIKDAGFKKTYIIYHNPEFTTNIFLHNTIYAIRN
ncbi:FkbM family methyltransferase [Acidianus sp. RZ1]|uniref:FkbM family methyltransferase n=1 Tax=Acidianus sp. RZ1 TaxID=1540082 RepID=UPI0014927E6A|nr:FkbM family methyltransferase [Acidianus sp. RZ1]NON61659.1 FkbM family methyltransferase [Acidianus sp. RZ1]